MYTYINTQNMASDQTNVKNTIAKYNYNTFIHTHTFFLNTKLYNNSIQYIEYYQIPTKNNCM